MIKKINCIALLLLLSFVVRSQDADEIISRYISFTGGAQAWKKITSIISSGTYNYGGMEFPFTAWSKAPDRYKYIVSFKGKSFMQAYDGHKGWRIDGFKNETKKTLLTGPDAYALANEADVELVSPFIDYREKGHAIQFEGQDTVENKICFKIRLTRKRGDVETYYFDSENYALVKKQAVSRNTELDKALLDIFYKDYKSVGGIKLAQKITCISNGQTILDITVNKIKLNQPVADSIFRP